MESSRKSVGWQQLFIEDELWELDHYRFFQELVVIQELEIFRRRYMSSKISLTRFFQKHKFGRRDLVKETVFCYRLLHEKTAVRLESVKPLLGATSPWPYFVVTTDAIYHNSTATGDFLIFQDAFVFPRHRERKKIKKKKKESFFYLLLLLAEFLLHRIFKFV